MELRTERKLSQKALAEQIQLAGYEFSDLTVLRIEKGTRFVPDYEVVALAEFFLIFRKRYYYYFTHNNHLFNSTNLFLSHFPFINNCKTSLPYDNIAAIWQCYRTVT